MTDSLIAQSPNPPAAGLFGSGLLASAAAAACPAHRVPIASAVERDRFAALFRAEGPVLRAA